MWAIEDRYAVDAVLRMRMGVSLNDYCLWELEDVLDGIKKAARLIAGEPAETPDDWFQRNAKHG